MRDIAIENHYKPGDRFTYVKMTGGFAHGTVLRVNGERVIAKLDCQKDGEEYCFHKDDYMFLKGEH